MSSTWPAVQSIWVGNKDYWVTRCDLLEKVKLRFDSEGIEFAFPQLELHYRPDRTRLENNEVPGLSTVSKH